MSPAALMVERYPWRITEYRATKADGSEFRARVMSDDLLDDYRTHFAPGQWTAQLEAGDYPPLLYGHNWQSLAEVLGAAIGHTDTRAALELVYRLDVDANPLARQAAAQLRSGTLREFSVGFTRHDDEPSELFPGATRITASYLDETSVVPRGAVAGTAVLSMPRAAYRQLREMPVEVRRRTLAGRQVPVSVAAPILHALEDGRITLAEARRQIEACAQLPDLPPDLAEELAEWEEMAELRYFMGLRA